MFGAISLSNTVDSFRRVDAASGGAVTFSKTGRYSVYYERVGIKNRSDVPPIRITLSGGGRSQTLASDSASTSEEHYHLGDHEGVRIGKLTIADPGRYQVTVNGEPTGSSADRIAFGKGSIVTGIVGVVGGLLGGGLMAFIGLIVLIVTAVRRSSHRRRMASAGYGGGPGAPGGYQPGPWPPAGTGCQSRSVASGRTGCQSRSVASTGNPDRAAEPARAAGRRAAAATPGVPPAGRGPRPRRPTSRCPPVIRIKPVGAARSGDRSARAHRPAGRHGLGEP